MLHALVIDDDEVHAGHVADVLRERACCTLVASADAALRVLREVLPDVVLTDLRGVASHPVEHLTSLRLALDTVSVRLSAPPVPIVLVSGLDHEALHALARAVPGVSVVCKPYSAGDLRASVARTCAPTRRTGSAADCNTGAHAPGDDR